MNNRSLFELSDSEKSRILSLHESATKKLYLKEENDPSESFETFQKLKPDSIGNYIFMYIVKQNKFVTPESVRNFYRDIESNHRKGSKLIKLIDGIEHQDRVSGGGLESFTKIGNFLLKNNDLLKSVYDFLKQNNVMLRMTY